MYEGSFFECIADVEYRRDDEMKKYYWYDSMIGPLTIVEYQGALYQIEFGKGEYALQEQMELNQTLLIQQVYQQLEEYFHGKRTRFDLPLHMEGTDFQKKVWNELQKIPYGKTCSYKEIALAIGNEKACRAVGSANNKNKIPIIIPCHRVIGANHKLVGYAGGLEIKKKLLELEQTMEVDQ